MSVKDDAQNLLKSAAASWASLSALVDSNAELAPLEPGVSAALGGLVDAQNALSKMSIAPLVSGLFVEGGHSPVPQVENTICNVHWSDLQNVSRGPIMHPNPIDHFLTTRKTANWHVRLFFGRYSPKFAFDHGSITMSAPTDGITAPVPNWWNAALQDDQRDLINKLAKEYDGLIPLIFIATPMTVYAEPMMRGGSDGRAAAKKAGLTEEEDKKTFYTMLTMFSVFEKTRLGLAFNPKQLLDGGDDVLWTIKLMDDFRKLFGDQAHVQNNSIRTPPLKGHYPALYDHMKGMHPSGYQTATEARIGDWAQTLQWAVDQGAHMVELSPGFQKHLSAAQLTKFDSALRKNGAAA